MSVLLPAPFSPTMACSSPARIVKETSFRATTPGNRFVTCSISMMGWPGVMAASIILLPRRQGSRGAYALLSLAYLFEEPSQAEEYQCCQSGNSTHGIAAPRQFL